MSNSETVDEVSSAISSLTYVNTYGVQPGWVRSTFSTPNMAGYQSGVASVGCSSGSPSSVTATWTALSPSLSAVDVKANLPWLANNSLPVPCAVNSVSLSFTGQSGTLASTASVNYHMDLPIAYMTPNNQASAVYGTSVSLQPTTRRYAAYPPRIVAIKSNGGNYGVRTAFVEVEERLDRGTLGMREMIAFGNGNVLDRELGGGAEMYANVNNVSGMTWGLDVDMLGITKVTGGVEESNPGSNTFTWTGGPSEQLTLNDGGTGVFSGTLPSIIDDNPADIVLPAPPLFGLPTYLHSVLDNHGIPRCSSPNGCLDVVYDASNHLLTAVNGASVADLEGGPITSTSVASTPTTVPPSGTPPMSTSVWGISPVASTTPANPIHAVPSCGLNAANTEIVVSLTPCAGASAAISCPTLTDNIDPDSFPTGGTGPKLSLSRYMPYYGGRANVIGDCMSQAAGQYGEYLYNRLAADVLPSVGVTVDGQTISVANPPIGLSPIAEEVSNLNWQNAIDSTDPIYNPWPASASDHSPWVPEAYWPAREPDLSTWETSNPTATSMCPVTAPFPPSSFCIGQGQPPPGAYWTYAQNVSTWGNNPFTGGVYGVADTFLDTVAEPGVPPTRANQTQTSAFQWVINVLQQGLVVYTGLGSVDFTHTNDEAGTFTMGNGMTWYLPPELATCSLAQLNNVLNPTGSQHQVNIVGYSLSYNGSVIDPISSYFIIENNWGKNVGRGGFWAMNFAAFNYMTTSLETFQLNCDYNSPACTNPMTTYTWQQVPNASAVDVGDDGYHVTWFDQNQKGWSWSHNQPLSQYAALTGHTGTAIDVGAYGPWTIDTGELVGHIMTSTGVQKSVMLPPGNGPFLDVGVSPDGNTVYIVTGPESGAGGPIYKWLGPNGGANPWVQMQGQYGVRIDAANDGSAWYTTSTGTVFHVSGNPAAPTVATIGPQGTLASDITVGYYGNVFVVGGFVQNGVLVPGDFVVYSYNASTNNWVVLPGAYGWRLSAGISPFGLSVVEAEGQVWTTERVYQH